MKKYLIVASMVVVCGWIVQFPVWSQQPVPAPVPVPPGTVIPRFDSATGTTTYTYQAASSQSQSEISQLMKALVEADDDAKKTDITKKLETAVEKQFDEDMKVRESELTKI